MHPRTSLRFRLVIEPGPAERLVAREPGVDLLPQGLPFEDAGHGFVQPGPVELADPPEGAHRPPDALMGELGGAQGIGDLAVYSIQMLQTADGPRDLDRDEEVVAVQDL